MSVRCDSRPRCSAGWASPPSRGHRGEAFRIGLVGYALLLVGAVVEYWTPYLDFGFTAFSAPGLLLTLLGSTLLGIALLRGDAVARAGSWLLALSIPLVLGMTALVGHLSGGLLPLDLAWIVLGLWLSSRPRSAA